MVIILFTSACKPSHEKKFLIAKKQDNLSEYCNYIQEFSRLKYRSGQFAGFVDPAYLPFIDSSYLLLAKKFLTLDNTKKFEELY